jgi:hypothetical protein
VTQADLYVIGRLVVRLRLNMSTGRASLSLVCASLLPNSHRDETQKLHQLSSAFLLLNVRPKV